MNSTTHFSLIAALTDAGVLIHYIYGVIGLLVLGAVGISLHKRQNRLLNSRLPKEENGADRAFGRVQMWALYWVVVAVAIAFFFVMPRATSQKRQALPSQNAGAQTWQ